MEPGGLIPYPTPAPAAQRLPARRTQGDAARPWIRLRPVIGLAAAVVCAFFGARQLARPAKPAPIVPRAQGADIHLPRSTDTAFRIIRDTVQARVYTPSLQSLTSSSLTAGQADDRVMEEKRATSAGATSGDAVRA